MSLATLESTFVKHRQKRADHGARAEQQVPAMVEPESAARGRGAPSGWGAIKCN